MLTLYRVTTDPAVAPREGRVSRNATPTVEELPENVAPREGRVSRNLFKVGGFTPQLGRAPRGACE